MNTDKLEVKLMALVVSCRTMESQEEIGNQIMQCADDIVKNCYIPAVVGRREQLKAFLLWLDKDYEMGDSADIIVSDYIKSL